MGKFVEIPFSAMWPLRALVSVFGFASAAIQISTTRYSFQFVLEFLVRPALTSGKDEVMGIGAGLTNFVLLESCKQ
jgi:hypothetical protein